MAVSVLSRCRRCPAHAVSVLDPSCACTATLPLDPQSALLGCRRHAQCIGAGPPACCHAGTVLDPSCTRGFVLGRPPVGRHSAGPSVGTQRSWSPPRSVACHRTSRSSSQPSFTSIVLHHTLETSGIVARSPRHPSGWFITRHPGEALSLSHLGIHPAAGRARPRERSVAAAHSAVIIPFSIAL